MSQPSPPPQQPPRPTAEPASPTPTPTSTSTQPTPAQPAIRFHTPTPQRTSTPQSAVQPAPAASHEQTQPPEATTTPIATLATPAPTNATPAPPTYFEKLRAGDANWIWQLGLRAVTVVVGIIGIGCLAWAVSKYSYGHTPYNYELDDGWTMQWGLITLGASVIFSSICILVFLLRRPNAPVHPGVRVGVDLILWLAFIPTALFAVVGVMSVYSMGNDGTLGYNYYSSSGHYKYIPSNDTWVWDSTDPSDLNYSQTRSCNGSSSSSSYSYYYADYGFSSCAEEDAYVNAMWHGKSARFNTELTGVVCQFIALVVHFALFVWACVDTHRRNSRKVGKDAEQLAADIVMNMVRSGAVVQAPGAVQMRPMGPQMMPQQMWQQYYPQQYGRLSSRDGMPQPGSSMQGPPQQYPQYPVGPVASISTNEKGKGPRYA